MKNEIYTTQYLQQIILLSKTSLRSLHRNNVLMETQRKPKRLYLGNQLNEDRREGHDNVTRKFEDDNDVNNDMFPKDNYARVA